jgi:hypothetical protein
MVETFFKTLKAELVWRTIFQSRIEAASAIGRYIDGFYNPVRDGCATSDGFLVQRTCRTNSTKKQSLLRAITGGATIGDDVISPSPSLS